MTFKDERGHYKNGVDISRNKNVSFVSNDITNFDDSNLVSNDITNLDDITIAINDSNNNSNNITLGTNNPTNDSNTNINSTESNTHHRAFEQTYVYDFYDNVANHFSFTRKAPWQKVPFSPIPLLNCLLGYRVFKLPQ